MTTTQYYVYSNLHHDGRAYRPGDVVSLSEKAAARLIASGVVGTEKPIDPAPAPSNDRVQTPEQKGELREAKVGGEPSNSGEPSLDAKEPAERKEAEDVGPKVSESMKRDDLENAARKEGISKDDIAAASTKADLVKLIESANGPAERKEAEVDASADL